jgi:hypothetical protein
VPRWCRSLLQPVAGLGVDAGDEEAGRRAEPDECDLVGGGLRQAVEVGVRHGVPRRAPRGASTSTRPVTTRSRLAWPVSGTGLLLLSVYLAAGFVYSIPSSSRSAGSGTRAPDISKTLNLDSITAEVIGGNRPLRATDRIRSRQAFIRCGVRG